MMEMAYRRYLTAAERVAAFPFIVPRIARGDLATHHKLAINEYLARHEAHRGSHFNDFDYYYFQFPDQAEAMAAFLLDKRLHRLVPGSQAAPTPQDVQAEWPRIAAQREAILAWARTNGQLMSIVQTYRFERKRGAYSSTAHEEAAKLVQRIDPAVADPRTCAGVCIEWAERQNRDWFWRCAPDHPYL